MRQSTVDLLPRNAMSISSVPEVDGCATCGRLFAAEDGGRGRRTGDRLRGRCANRFPGDSLHSLVVRDKARRAVLGSERARSLSRGQRGVENLGRIRMASLGDPLPEKKYHKKCKALKKASHAFIARLASNCSPSIRRVAEWNLFPTKV